MGSVGEAVEKTSVFTPKIRIKKKIDYRWSSRKNKVMKVGITFSAFDLLHAGHVKMLEDAKRECDYLICALQTDPI